MAVFVLACSASVFAQTAERWVQTWGTANFSAPGATGTDALETAAPAAEANGNAGTTLRNYVRVSLGGERLRLVLSNEFGTSPLVVGGTSVAVGEPNGAVHPVQVLFEGRTTVTISPGSSIASDPVALRVAPLSTLAVSLYLPNEEHGPLTQHLYSFASNVAAPGNQVMTETLQQTRPHPRWFYLKGVDVAATPGEAAIVAIGDSITDGVGSTTDGHRRWTDDLAGRLQANAAMTKLAVVDKGIGGNRVLHDGVGPSALSRFDRDVLTVPGVKYVIFLEGINDIGRSAKPTQEGDVIDAAQLISGYAELIKRAHAAGLKIYAGTLTPYQGAGYASPEGQEIRLAVNKFIREGKQFDGYIDFAKAVADPSHPLRYLPQYDHGDHLHPSDAGYKAMADSIDLNLFR